MALPSPLSISVLLSLLSYHVELEQSITLRNPTSWKEKELSLSVISLEESRKKSVFLLHAFSFHFCIRRALRTWSGKCDQRRGHNERNYSLALYWTHATQCHCQKFTWECKSSFVVLTPFTSRWDSFSFSLIGSSWSFRKICFDFQV